MDKAASGTDQDLSRSALLQGIFDARFLQVEVYPGRGEALFLGGLIKLLDDLSRSPHRFRLSQHLKLVAPMVDFHPEAPFQLPQMLIETAAQVGKPIIIFGL
jgi:hypothetical protein